MAVGQRTASWPICFWGINLVVRPKEEVHTRKKKTNQGCGRSGVHSGIDGGGNTYTVSHNSLSHRTTCHVFGKGEDARGSKGKPHRQNGRNTKVNFRIKIAKMV